MEISPHHIVDENHRYSTLTRTALLERSIEVSPAYEAYALAESFRNPHREQLLHLADVCSDIIYEYLPDGVTVEQGGSLVSNTAITGQNDIDLKALLPNSNSTQQDIESISERLTPFIPYQKVRWVRIGPDHRFAIKHCLDLDVANIDDPVKIDLVIQPADGRIGAARLQTQLPQGVLDQYVIHKFNTQDNKPDYKKIKQQFYAMTRWLHALGYMDVNTGNYHSSQLLDEAESIFWGNDPQEILSRPEPKS